MSDNDSHSFRAEGRVSCTKYFWIDYFMNQHIRPLREPDQIFGESGVARKHNRVPCKVDPVVEAPNVKPAPLLLDI